MKVTCLILSDLECPAKIPKLSPYSQGLHRVVKVVFLKHRQNCVTSTAQKSLINLHYSDTNPFIHSKGISAYYVPGTVLDTWNIKMKAMGPAPKELRV